ncbi:MAG: hypothetical protein KKE55_07410, partial [Candidatus Omnitrophica bacterium]|nr:hypothetical protein [Candidatus Omnitrophota bacterium]
PTSTITGSTTFPNLTCVTASKALTFEAGVTQTITGALNLNGQATGTRIVLNSDNPGALPANRFSLSVSEATTAYYLDVSNAEALGFDITARDSLDTSNNDAEEGTPQWVFGYDIGGLVYSDRGTTLIGSGKSIALIINGASQGAEVTDGSSNYIFSKIDYSSGDLILVYIDGDAVDGNTIAIAGTPADITDLNIYGSTVIARHENAGPITNTTFDTGYYADAGNVVYTDPAGTGNLALSSGTDFLVWTGDTYTPGGNLTTDELIIQTGATYTAGSGTITVSGDFTNAGTFTPGTSTVIFDGTTSLTSGGSLLNNAQIGTDTASGSVTLADAADIDGLLTFNTTGGTASLDLSSQTLNYAGAALDLTLADTFTATGSTVIFDGTTTLTSAGNSFNNVQIGSATSGGSLTLADEADIDGAVSVGSANPTEFVLTGKTLLYGGSNLNLNNLDIFTVAGSTVTLDGAGAQSITSESNIYNNLTITNASGAGVTFADAFSAANLTCNTASAKLTFGAGLTYTIIGTLTLNGQATGTRIVLDSSDGATRFNFDVSGGAQNVYYVDVSNSGVAGTAGNDITARYSVNGGNNDDADASPHWIFTLDILGTVYSDRGITGVGAGYDIALVINGASQGSADTDAGSEYNFVDVTYSSGDVILVYINNEDVQGNTVTIGASGSIYDLHIYGDAVIARHETAGPVTNAVFNTAKGEATDPDILYSVSGSDLTMISASAGFLVWQDKTYTPGGDLDAGDIIIQTGAIFSPEANTINISGDWANSGTFTAGAGAVIFDKTTGAQTLNAGASSFYDLQHTQAGTLQLLTNNLAVT